MANTLQKRAKRISLVLPLAAVLFTAVDNYLYLCHGINITPVTTPVIIILVVSIVLCGVLQRYFYRWLIKYSLFPSANRQKLEVAKTERTRAAVTEQAENRAETIEIEPVKEATKVAAGITAGPHRDPYMERYNQLLEEMKQQEARRHAELMEAIREYVTVATAPSCRRRPSTPSLPTSSRWPAAGRTPACRCAPTRTARCGRRSCATWHGISANGSTSRSKSGPDSSSCRFPTSSTTPPSNTSSATCGSQPRAIFQSTSPTKAISASIWRRSAAIGKNEPLLMKK